MNIIKTLLVMLVLRFCLLVVYSQISQGMMQEQLLRASSLPNWNPCPNNEQLSTNNRPKIKEYLRVLSNLNYKVANVTTVSSNGVYPGSYNTSVLLPNGTVIMAPYNAGNQLASYNYLTDTIITNLATTPTAPGYGGSVLLPSGKVLFIPTLISIGLAIFDPNTGVFDNTNLQYHATLNKWQGGVLLPNGKVFMNPVSPLTNCAVYDPVANTIDRTPIIKTATSIPVLLFDGRVYCGPQSTARNIWIYTWKDNVATTNGLPFSPSFGAFIAWDRASALLFDGRVFQPPYQATTYGIYDPVANTFTTGGVIFAAANRYNSCRTMPDGKVFMLNGATTNAAVFNPLTKILSTNIGVFVANQFQTSQTLPNGNIILLPGSTSTKHVIYSNTMVRLPDMKILTSPFYNRR